MLFWERKTGLLRIIENMTSGIFLGCCAFVVTSLAIWWVVIVYRPLCVQELALRHTVGAAAQQGACAAGAVPCNSPSIIQAVSAFSQVDFLALVRRHGGAIITQRCKKPELVEDFLWHEVMAEISCSYLQLRAICCDLELLPQVIIKELIVDKPKQGMVFVRIVVRILIKR